MHPHICMWKYIGVYCYIQYTIEYIINKSPNILLYIIFILRIINIYRSPPNVDEVKKKNSGRQHLPCSKRATTFVKFDIKHFDFGGRWSRRRRDPGRRRRPAFFMEKKCAQREKKCPRVSRWNPWTLTGFTLNTVSLMVQPVSITRF